MKFSYGVSVGGRFEPRGDAEAGQEAGRERGAARTRCKALIYPISAKISLPQQHVSREFPVLNKPAIVSGFLEKRAQKKEIKKKKKIKPKLFHYGLDLYS